MFTRTPGIEPRALRNY